MTAKPRRWFSFSLRTMFVVVTLLCCYLAWQMSIVRQRQSLLAELRTQPGAQVTTAAAWLQLLSPGPSQPKMATIPRVRIWLGDEAIQSIGLARGYHRLNQSHLDELKRTFPESNVHEYEMPLEPCHPGCFPRGTPVATPQGPRPIESIQVGDDLTAFPSNGRQIVVRVQSVFVTKNRLWRIETTDGVLLTTETQPLCLAADRTLPAGELQPGDEVLRCENGQLHETRVLRVTPTDRVERVFNLVLGNRELFIAGGFLARSKPPSE